ncbi:MAG: hypothetical protein GY772_12065 [bacterium]|nr:hypothetical protein [bacterium]
MRLLRRHWHFNHLLKWREQLFHSLSNGRIKVGLRVKRIDLIIQQRRRI